MDYEYPFRNYLIEEILNSESISADERISKIINSISDNITNDISGSSEYRKFMSPYNAI